MAEYRGAKPDVPADLCWLYVAYMADYPHDADLCRQSVMRNRERMTEEILAIAKLDASSVFHTVRNFIDVREMILRKGSIAAYEG